MNKGEVMKIRDVVNTDYEQILALNAESVHFLSPLDMTRLENLAALTVYQRVIEANGKIGAFLLAFPEGTNYDSVNYQWFAERFQHFLYIDRIVVAMSLHRIGLGKRLYEDLILFARQRGIDQICCEFYVDPPNEVSKAFHARFGFYEVGQQSVMNGSKLVSLQMLTLQA